MVMDLCTLEKIRLDHAISSAVTATKLLLRHSEEIKKNKKEKCSFLKFLELLNFLLPGLVIVHTAFFLTFRTYTFFGSMLPKSWYI